MVLLRSGLKEIGPFEQEVLSVCRVARITTQLCTPWAIEGNAEDRPTYIGREGVLHRDNTMVSLADLVLAFVTPDEIPSEMFSGTRHVVDAALAKDIPVFLYSVAKDGTVERVGEHDPDNQWTGRVPSPA
jgi:nucleoside 2-deoxyribosyltransferase